MSLTAAQREEAAEALRVAEETQVAIPPLIQTYPEIDVVDAYEIQLLNIRRRLAAGATVHGHKVGLSSKAMQEMMGVDEPDYGHLLSDMVYTEDAPIPTGSFLIPRVEVEVGRRVNRAGFDFGEHHSHGNAVSEKAQHVDGLRGFHRALLQRRNLASVARRNATTQTCLKCRNHGNDAHSGQLLNLIGKGER